MRAEDARGVLIPALWGKLKLRSISYTRRSRYYHSGFLSWWGKAALRHRSTEVRSFFLRNRRLMVETQEERRGNPRRSDYGNLSSRALFGEKLRTGPHRPRQRKP